MSELCLICLRRSKISHWYDCYQCKNYICCTCGRQGGYIMNNGEFVCSIKCVFSAIEIDKCFSILDGIYNHNCVYDIGTKRYITDDIINEQQLRLNKVHAKVISVIIDEYIIKDLHKIIIEFLMMTTTT